MIKVPFPEFNDVIQALAGVEKSLDVEVEISTVTVAAFLAIAAQLESKNERVFYTGRILKWHNTTAITSQTNQVDR